jgi:hypothetical protein
MLRPINKDAPLQQGDIIRDVPFIVFPKMFNVKIPDIPGQSRINSQELDSFTKLKELSQGKNLAATTVPFVLTPRNGSHPGVRHRF